MESTWAWVVSLEKDIEMTNSPKSCGFCGFIHISVTFIALAGLSCSAQGMTVPAVECPIPSGSLIMAACNWAERTCVRCDSSITVVDKGTEKYVLGTEASCENCVADCPEPELPPPPMSCVVEPSVSYTETVTATVAGGITLDAALLQASLETSIGHADERSVSLKASCGTTSLPSCQKVTYTASLAVRENVQTRIHHKYKWKIEIYHNPKKCDQIEFHLGPYPAVTYNFAGERTSTAKGTVYGAVSCKTVGTSNCSTDEETVDEGG